ncbi:MAG: hypothetical protein Pars92KO_03280 [Parasphingorhabdus sp.]
MNNGLSDSLSGVDSSAKWPVVRILTGFLLFCGAYALINQVLLTHSVLYRAAAYDYVNASWALLSFAAQALLLFAATILLPRKWFLVCITFVGISAGINGIYSQIVGDTLDLQKSGWLLTEARQAGAAAGEFAAPLGLALGKLLISIILMIGARRALRDPVRQLTANQFAGGKTAPALIALLIAPSFLWPPLGLYPLAAERNIYNFAAAIVTADPPPARAEVSAIPGQDTEIDKIIWLIDESVSHDGFNRIIAPKITEIRHIDFGEAASMGHCSTPSNVALRSGVNVRRVNTTTDLRRTASIWAYAAKAGYFTTMIDGQVTGPPQNLLLAPERALIGSYRNVDNGQRTDLAIARMLNADLKSEGKQFTYALLRGVHFQYRDHYPKGALPDGSSTQAQYDKAISYSKAGFFDALLDGVDRSRVAIFYTSDHGQNIRDGVTPHCSGDPVQEEFSVPLIAFLPAGMHDVYGVAELGGRSLSQLFPTSLGLMGYEAAYATENYDNALTVPTARFVWFGRGVVPVKDGGTIDVWSGEHFPGR